MPWWSIWQELVALWIPTSSRGKKVGINHMQSRRKISCQTLQLRLILLFQAWPMQFRSILWYGRIATEILLANIANWLRTIATQGAQKRNQSISQTSTTAIKQCLKTCKASKGSRRQWCDLVLREGPTIQHQHNFKQSSKHIIAWSTTWALHQQSHHSIAIKRRSILSLRSCNVRY